MCLSKSSLASIALVYLISFSGYSQKFEKKEVKITYEKRPIIELPTNVKKYYCEINTRNTQGYFTESLELNIGVLENIGNINAFNGLPTTKKRWITNPDDIKNSFLKIKGIERVDAQNEADLIIKIDFGWVIIFSTEKIGREVNLTESKIYEEGYIYQFYCDNKLTVTTKEGTVLIEKMVRERQNPYYLKFYERDYTSIQGVTGNLHNYLLYDAINQDVLGKIKTELSAYSRSNEQKTLTLFKPSFKSFNYKDIQTANNLILETSFFFTEEKNKSFPKIKEAITIYERALMEEGIEGRINSEIAEHIHANLTSAYWIIGDKENAKKHLFFLTNFPNTKREASCWSTFLN